MLKSYTRQGDQLIAQEDIPTATAIWYDLLSPTVEEDRTVEARLSITIPSREEMEEIELSSRLYREDGATFMTLTTLAQLDTDAPIKTPVTFIVKDGALVTVRYVEAKPFIAYVHRAQRQRNVPCGSAEDVMFGIIESIIDRTADALEKVGFEIDAISREVFGKTKVKVDKKTRDLQSLLNLIGQKTELMTMVQESLVSISRLVAFHVAGEERGTKVKAEGAQLVKLIQRDAASLGEHARALTARLSFLLDATLGMINLEQNQIIKIFSVAAVVFLPPTLVASIYGMNFDVMPELKWVLGYPFALVLMVISAALPFLYFKRKGWL